MDSRQPSSVSCEDRVAGKESLLRKRKDLQGESVLEGQEKILSGVPVTFQFLDAAVPDVGTQVPRHVYLYLK